MNGREIKCCNEWEVGGDGDQDSGKSATGDMIWEKPQNVST